MKGSNQPKTALVLAGGGLTGAVYEIGALRAIDDLLVDRTTNDFDVYVGTSAGAFISAFLASGISPEVMLETVEGSNAEIPPIMSKQLFGVNYGDLISWGIKIPKNIFSTWVQYFRNYNEMTVLDLMWSFFGVLPAGLYDSHLLEKYVESTLSCQDCQDDFQELAHELYIIATALESGERVVFGTSHRDDVPISLAVAASSALPLIYKPVRIAGEEFVDGGLRGNASLDLAIESGAKLIVCINPLVPFNYGSEESQYPDSISQQISDMGLQAIANQTLRISSHASLHYHIKQLRRVHPEVDIILIEPKPEDYHMFSYNLMNYSELLTVARHGFEAATLDLAEDYYQYKCILARHGIPITRRLVIKEIEEIQKSNYNREVIQQVLEARAPGCGQRNRDTPLCRLTRSLAELELALDSLS
jgi:predicted acylesterase/phospholipase RssA